VNLFVPLAILLCAIAALLVLCVLAACIQSGRISEREWERWDE
jgi:hypothetical protein